MRVDKSQVLPIGASVAKNKREKSAGAGAVDDIILGEDNNQPRKRNNNAKREFDDST
jgi:hypothetical protein